MSTTVIPAIGSAALQHGEAFDAPVTYERIAASIAAVTVHGAEVRVHWKNPLTGAPMGESSAMMSVDTSLAARVKGQAKRSVVQEIAAAFMRALSGTLGGALGGSAGRIVRDMAYTASHDLQTRVLAGVNYTESTRREAVVRAFAAVQDRFTWDASSRRFIVR
jgi:hypothetical protein